MKRQFLLALPLLLAACAQPSGQWKFEGSKDAITDEPRAATWVPSSNSQTELLITCSGTGGPPSIMLKATRRLGGYADEENYIKRTVSYRFDDGKVEYTTGIIGDDMLGFQEGSGGKRHDGQMLAKIGSAKKLAIQTSDWQNNQIQQVFEVTGAGRAIEQVSEHCKTT
jgi:hypothetical protein